MQHQMKSSFLYPVFRTFYTVLMTFAIPFFFLRLWWRGRKNTAYRQRWLERLGIFGHNPPPGGLWLHAVSVGESVAAVPFVRAFQKRYPALPIIFTTSTVTGSDRVRSIFGDSVFHVYFPYDHVWCFQKFIRSIRPKVLVLTETEIWPNCLHICREHEIPVMMMNARLSPRSAKGYGRFGFLMRELLKEIRLVAAQSELDGARFLALGLEPNRLQVAGNIKFDVCLKPETASASKQLREALGDRPIFIAASTHQDEENQVLKAFSLILKQFKDVLLILVPRHPARFEAVADLIQEQGFRFVKRSSKANVTPETQVFLGDTMGELELFYGISDIAFVGGSLVPIGGHNTLEPAVQGVPSIVGPQVHNFLDITKLLVDAGGLVQISDSTTLADAVIHWLSHSDERKSAGQKAKTVVEKNRGAVDRILECLRPFVESVKYP